MDNEYPKAIYLDGGAELVWGEPIQTSAVNSADEEDQALGEGWRLHPLRAEGGETVISMPRRGRPPKSEAA